MRREVEENFVPLEIVEKPFQLPQWVDELSNAGYSPSLVLLPEPTSYCAGVERANKATDEFIAEVVGQGRVPYLFHAPIHSESKLKEWTDKGAVLVNEPTTIPPRSDVFASAHGVGNNFWELARENEWRGRDATCPLVEKTHRDIAKEAGHGAKVLLVGREGHDEVEGSKNIAPEQTIVVSPKISDNELAYLMELVAGEDLAVSLQTTLAIDDTKKLTDKIAQIRPDTHFPRVSDICYATQNRQDALRQAIEVGNPQLVVVFGSDENSHTPSSNSIRLRELASSYDVRSVLVEDVTELSAQVFHGVEAMVVTAGASAAPQRAKEFLECMKALGVDDKNIRKIVTADEPQVFSAARYFDFSSH